MYLCKEGIAQLRLGIRSDDVFASFLKSKHYRQDWESVENCLGSHGKGAENVVQYGDVDCQCGEDGLEQDG